MANGKMNNDQKASVIVSEVMAAFGSGAASAGGPFEDGQIFESQAAASRFAKKLHDNTKKNLDDGVIDYNDWTDEGGGNGSVDRKRILRTAAKHGKYAAIETRRPDQHRLTWDAIKRTFKWVKETDCQKEGPVCGDL